MAELFNNRELASLFWLLVFFGWLILRPGGVSVLGTVIRTAFVWKLTVFYVLMIAYLALIVYILSLVDLWKISNFKLTFIWLLTSGIAMLFRYFREQDHSFINKILHDQIKIIVVIEFVVNLYSFSLWIELLMVLFAIVLTATLTISESDEKYRRVENLLTWILALYGTLVLVFTLLEVVPRLDQYVTLTAYREFLLPILLTVAFIPFLYLVAVYVAYEMLFVRLNYFVKDTTLVPYAKRRLFLSFLFNLNAVGKWSQHMNKIWMESKSDIDEAIEKFKNPSPTP